MSGKRPGPPSFPEGDGAIPHSGGDPPPELLRFVFESASEAFWAWDPRAETAYVSPRCYSMLGIVPEEVPATRRTDEAGRYAGAFGIFRDITDRKRAESAVKESEERYRQLIESLPHGVGVVTRDEVKFVNGAALHILGYEDEAALIG